MNKLYTLTVMIALQSIMIINAAQINNRPAIYNKLDRITEQDPIDWNAVFTTLDNNRGSFSVEAYRSPNTLNTLLEEAIFEKNVPVTQKLLKEYNADPNFVKDETKLMPLMIACLIKDPALMRLLISYGANPYLRNRQDQSSFDFVRGRPALMGILDTYKKNK
jgi:ankyrin repeat protein